MKDIIRVEQLSKAYRLGEINTGSLSHDLSAWWQRVSGKGDRYDLLAEENDRRTKSMSGYVWSLKDISFSVGQGEVFGIVGKNGAGKSTLLKLLSKITRPSRGCIKIGGRIASLLEVGTGFHPDLSGRENVFLNGAILGMRKKEIASKFDEIVDFSGIERYIDTPVKRYSSGMFVRLAFAVAAHLEPEIMIIDEVLAVGDAEFQKKCLGKMRDISMGQGRTVLFVSHNMSAVKQLCQRGLFLENGQTKMIDSIDAILDAYQDESLDIQTGKRRVIPNDKEIVFLEWRLKGRRDADHYRCHTREKVTIGVQVEAMQNISSGEFQIMIRYQEGSVLVHASSKDFSGSFFDLTVGKYEFQIEMELPVRKGKYDVEFGFLSQGKWMDNWHSSTRLTVLEDFETLSESPYPGILNPKTKFEVMSISEPIIHG